MPNPTADPTQGVATGVGFGIEPDVAEAVVAAYADAARIAGHLYDPATWSNTVWLAEADRWRRSRDKDTFVNLVLHLQQLGGAWEAKAARGARGWVPGHAGERLTKR